jgi:hypothetical protein
VANGQLTGMRGVFLVAAELAARGLIVSPTSRSARGADLLATAPDCRTVYSIQVKTNARNFGFFLVGQHDATIKSESHVFVLVNIRYNNTEYFVIPSIELALLVHEVTSRTGTKWYEVRRNEIIATASKTNGHTSMVEDLIIPIKFVANVGMHCDPSRVKGVGNPTFLPERS